MQGYYEITQLINNCESSDAEGAYIHGIREVLENTTKLDTEEISPELAKQYEISINLDTKFNLSSTQGTEGTIKKTEGWGNKWLKVFILKNKSLGDIAVSHRLKSIEVYIYAKKQTEDIGVNLDKYLISNERHMLDFSETRNTEDLASLVEYSEQKDLGETCYFEDYNLFILRNVQYILKLRDFSEDEKTIMYKCFAKGAKLGKKGEKSHSSKHALS